MADLSTLRELCIKMQSLQEQKAVLDEQSTELTKALDDIRLKQIPEMMDQLEVKNATFPGIGRVQLAADLYCSTKAGQKDAAITWLRDCGYEGMVTEGYNASSLKALVRRFIEDGTEVPEFLNITPFIRASIVKA
ncbi:MAG: hypothetical protein WAV93_11465 [Bacteroidales bacterium]